MEQNFSLRMEDFIYNSVTFPYQDFLYDKQIALSKWYWLLFPEVLFLLF